MFKINTITVYLKMLFVLIIVLLINSESVAQDKLIFGVHPYLTSTELIKKYTPFAEYLSEKTDKNISIKIAKDYDHHIDTIGNGEVDIAYIGPAPYVGLIYKYGMKIEILARIEVDGKDTYQGVIFTKKDSKINSIADLKGRSFAFGDVRSTMSYFLPKYVMHQAGINMKDLKSYNHIKNHKNIVLSVLLGQFDAGSIREDVFYKYEERGLKIVKKTPRISKHVFIAGKHLPEETIDKVRQALYSLKNDPEGSTIMSSINLLMTGLNPSKDSDFENLRNILNTLKNNDT